MNNFLLPNKKTVFLVVGLGLLIFVLSIINLLSGQTPEPIASPRPTSSPTSTNNLPKINPGTNTDSVFPQIYKEDSLEQNYQRIENKRQLSTDEENARRKLIAPFEGNSGRVYATNEFTINYLRTPQYFMVEILSNNTQQAKENSQNWFNEQGLSDEAICNLPAIFYISPAVGNYLASNNLEFDPTPRGCN